MFDTGAESLSISDSLWDNIKTYVQYTDCNEAGQYIDASGNTGDEKYIMLHEVTIGSNNNKYVIENVIVSIGGASELLGIGFFRKFRNAQWDMKKNNGNRS